ncbi:MAG: hypothetical protein HY423_08210 [Candidatus Lambdaproteobacteria bacterium]|nr:hypothetical protein [Candidatus Lambdaproteobacteria bacterium]
MPFKKKPAKKKLRQELQDHGVERFIHDTDREDWPTLTSELYRRVIENCPFGVAMITRTRDRNLTRLEVRVNPDFENEDVPKFIRRYFRISHYDGIFHAVEGLVKEGPHDLYKIVGPKLGLPLHSLIYRIEHHRREELKALLVFGGERLEGQMENRLRTVMEIMESPVRGAAVGAAAAWVAPPPPAEDDTRLEELLARLRLIRHEQLVNTDLDEVAALVNGLEAEFGGMPAPLQVKYTALRDYLVRQRAGQSAAAAPAPPQQGRTPQPNWAVPQGPDQDRS